MQNQITIEEIRTLLFVVYCLGLLTVLCIHYSVRLWHIWREDRQRRKDLIINRRTPFGI
jgi:hypothetical protein